MESEAGLLAPVYEQPHFGGEAEPPYKRARPDEEGLVPTLTCEGGALDTLPEEAHEQAPYDESAASSTAAPGETMLLPAEGLAPAPPQAAHEEAAPAEAHEEGAQLMGQEKGAEAAHPDEQSTPPPASTIVPEPALLPVTSIRHIMKRAMGGEQDAITDETVSVVQRCTTEFVSLVVSEARVRVAKEGRTSVTYSDIATALNALGFKQFQEPLKAHMTLHYGGSAIKRPPKRQRVEDDAAAYGAAFPCNPSGQALALPPADREGRTPAPASGSVRRQVACGQCEACCRDDCGTCLNCRDKPKFGGGGARSADGRRARQGREANWPP
jgi:histone H3/H4